MRFKLTVESDALLRYSPHISHNAMRLLSTLCNFVGKDNIVCVDAKTIEEVSKLSNRFLRRATRELKDKEDIFIDSQGQTRVNPWYAWKGDWSIRRDARIGWDKGKFEPDMAPAYTDYLGVPQNRS